MSNRRPIPQEYQMSEGVMGFCHGEWTEFAKQVDEGYERFWRKRGGMPSKEFLKEHGKNHPQGKNKKKR